MKNIKTYARFFEILCMILIPIILVAPALLWFFGDNLLDSTYGPDIRTLSLLQRAVIVFFATIGNAFLAYGFVLCIRIARFFRKDQIFTPVTAQLFAKLSRGAVWWGLYSIAINICLNYVVMSKSPQQLTLVSFGLVGLFHLFVFVFLSILATLVAKASSLQKDQDLTV